MVSSEQGNSSAQRSHPGVGVTPVTPCQGSATSATCHSSGFGRKIGGLGSFVSMTPTPDMVWV